MQFLHTTATRASENVKVLSNVSSTAHFLHTLARLSHCVSRDASCIIHTESGDQHHQQPESSPHIQNPNNNFFLLYGNFIAAIITLITQIFTIHQLTVAWRLDVLDTMQISTIERCIKHEIATTKVAQHFTTQFFSLSLVKTFRLEFC